MLRSWAHIRELLQNLPEAPQSENVPTSTLRDVLPASKRLKAGKYHWTNLRPRKPRTLPQCSANNTRAGQPSSTFVYRRALSSDTHQTIRLLDLHPGQPKDKIVCGLEYVSLQCVPDYQALSYCWESQPPTDAINCDGMVLYITANLYDALKALRLPFDHLLLWADAICINQQSIAEKNHQLLLMRSIYQKASSVQIWLGEDTPAQTGQEAFALLEELFFAYSKIGTHLNIWDKASNQALASCWIPALNEPVWQSLFELISRSWFTRAWIIQEVVLARKAYLNCGNLRLDWMFFCYGFLFAINTGLLSIQPGALFHDLAYQNVIALLVTYVSFYEGNFNALDLPSLLQNHRFSGASDAKDKIYALLSLAMDHYGTIPDYAQSIASIYINASKAIMLKDQSLDLLGIPRSSLINTLPSWVVDWATPHLASSLSSKTVQGQYMFDFKASRETLPALTVRGHSLLLKGHVFDTIVRAGKVFNPFKVSIDDTNPASLAVRIGQLLETVHDWHGVSECFTSSRSYPENSGSLLEMFCRTLFYDKFFDDYDLATAMQDVGGTRYARTIWAICAYILTSPKTRQLLLWYGQVFLRRSLTKVNGNITSMNTLTFLLRVLGRRLVVTKMGYFGLAPEITETGHAIYLVKGARAPLIFQKLDGTKLRLVGDCYIQGIMHGEAFKEDQCSEMEIV